MAQFLQPEDRLASMDRRKITRHDYEIGLSVVRQFHEQHGCVYKNSGLSKSSFTGEISSTGEGEISRSFYFTWVDLVKEIAKEIPVLEAIIGRPFGGSEEFQLQTDKTATKYKRFFFFSLSDSILLLSPKICVRNDPHLNREIFQV